MIIDKRRHDNVYQNDIHDEDINDQRTLILTRRYSDGDIRQLSASDMDGVNMYSAVDKLASIFNLAVWPKKFGGK